MIGIFDSGSGGLSVFREIIKLLPEESYVYYADNANCPYGEKSLPFIQDRSRAITEFLLSRGARIIVVACNTATAAAITTLRNEYPVRFIGMEPAVKPAALSSQTGVIGVLATAGTLKGSKYLTTKGIYEDDVRIVEHVGQGFVELAEAGILDGPVAEETVRRSLRPLLDAGADRIVLGCTHYPFLRNVIQRVAGPDVRIIDPAPAVARHLVDVMREEGLPLSEAATPAGLATGKGSAPSEPRIELVTSGDNTSAKRILDIVLEEDGIRHGRQ
ncbi:MAG: glutamate racemase [Bacteroidales bacterium]|nr:glutamate racemase [Bacteroidales bacterium]